MTTPPIVGGVPSMPQLQSAVAALPGYQRALEVAASADEWLRTQPPIQPVAAELEPRNTGHVTDEWIDAVQARSAALANHEKRRNIVLHQKQSAANEANQIVTAGIDLVLGALQADLAQLLADAKPLIEKLDGATTAEQAIAADAGPAWRQLTVLADDYANLRSAQRWLMTRAPRQIWRSCEPELPGEDHSNESVIRNIADIWPDWRTGGPNTRRTYLGEGTAPPLRHEPWPADSGPQLLVWLITSDAEPWLPNTRELRELWEERRNPTERPPDDAQPEPEPYESLLYGPLEAKRKRQAAQRRPDYERKAVPITHRTPPSAAELGVS